MKILIDFTQIPINKVGVGVYALRTFPLMFKKHPQDNFIVLVQDDDTELLQLNKLGSNIKIIKIKSKLFRKLIFRFLLEQIFIPLISRKFHCDIIHSLHYSYPLIKTKAKKVITIHDMTFFLFPELHTLPKRHFFKWFITKAVNSNNNIICVSNSTANDIKSFYPNYKSRIKVIPLASDIYTENELANVDINKFKLPEKYILFIGTLEPRKNIEGLLRAFAKIKNDTDLNLVIVGKKGWFYEKIFDIIHNENIADRVILTGFVSELEKYKILQQCTIFIYPSFYEGFGLPVLEAISMGKPTITSNVSSLPEVGGDGVIFIDPNDINNIGEKLLCLINNPELQYELIRKGYAQSQKFCWEKTAEKTFDFYKCNISNK